MRGSLGGLPLRAALKRGAWLALANWPIVPLQFVVVSVYRMAVAVPVVGGIFVVAVLAGGDVRSLLSLDLRAAIGLVAASLAHRPEALVTFLVAVGLVSIGGAGVLFLSEAGVRTVQVSAEATAGPIHRGALRPGALRDAARFSVQLFASGIRQFGRRFLLLGAWLCVAYVVIGAAGWGLIWALTVPGGPQPWAPLWGMGVIGVVVTAVLLLVFVNLVYALLQVVMVTDDCRLSQAIRRLQAFIRHDARQVAGVFAVVLLLTLLGSAASLLATAGLALVAWVPIVGLAVVPLQVAAWLVRGLVFHYLDLSAWSAYQSQYRRHVDPAAEEPPAAWVS